MRLTTEAERAIEQAREFSRGQAFDEFQALIRHTEEDALDSGELLELAGLCLVIAKGVEHDDHQDDSA